MARLKDYDRLYRRLENILKVGEVEKNLGKNGEVNFYAQLIDDAEGKD